MDYLKNANRAYQGIKRLDVEEFMKQQLMVRDAVNKAVKCGEHYAPLSKSAKHLLVTGHVSQTFWRRFETDHKKIITRKRQGQTSTKRAQVHCCICAAPTLMLPNHRLAHERWQKTTWQS